MTDPSAAAEPRLTVPRVLIVVLAGTGFLVSVLALRQFTSIIAPALLALILVIGVYPSTGFLRPRGTPMWLAATATLTTLLLVILGLAQSLACLSTSRSRSKGPEIETSALGWPNRSGALGLSETFLAALGPARVTPSSPAPTPNWSRPRAPLANASSMRSTMSVKQDRVSAEAMSRVTRKVVLAGQRGVVNDLSLRGIGEWGGVAAAGGAGRGDCE